MYKLDWLKANKDPAQYPVLRQEFGGERLQEVILSNLENGENPIIGVVRKYGIKTLSDAVALLERMALNPHVHGWIIAVNPRAGKDEQTLELLRQAYKWKSLSESASITFSSVPVCVLHIEQPEGAANSWTAGLSGPVAAVMHMLVEKKQEWHRVFVFCCLGETEIHPDQMRKFKTSDIVSALTFRQSPVWLHDALRVYDGDEQAQLAAIIAALDKLTLAIRENDLSVIDDDDLARLVPLLRNTGSCWQLYALSRIGLFDSQCNTRKGMEDHALLAVLIRYHECNLCGLDWMAAHRRMSFVHYADERIQQAHEDASKRPVQQAKFRDEVGALRGCLEAFFAAGRPTTVAPENQEFLIPE